MIKLNHALQKSQIQNNQLNCQEMLSMFEHKGRTWQQANHEVSFCEKLDEILRKAIRYLRVEKIVTFTVSVRAQI